MEEIRSFNKSFNADFCQELEMAITKVFANSSDNKLKHHWCDGVLHAPFYNEDENKEYLRYENIKKTKIIETTAWLGQDGQTDYNATVVLGEKALQKYAKGDDLSDCISIDRLIDWNNFDNENRKIKLVLD